MGKFDKILAALEKLLPEGSSMAEQVALRNNPEKYAEYLKTLDKLGPKEQRAAEMGYDLSKKLYHGTDVDGINQFKISNGGKSGPGVYVTPVKHEAKWYGKNVHELATSANIADLTDYDKTKQIAKELSIDDRLKPQDGTFFSGNYGELKEASLGRLKGSDQEKFSSLVGHERDKFLHDELKGAGYDGTKILQNGDEQVVNITDPAKIRSTNAAFDPRFAKSPYLLAGGAAMPMAGLENFKNDIAKPLTDKWEKLKSYITDPLSKQLDLTKDKSAASDIKSTLNMVGDPLNYIPGAPGVAAGAIQMLGTESEEEKAKREALRKMADGEL